MISDTQRATIRRLFFAEHWEVGTIAAELGIHHDAVHHAIESRSFLTPALRLRAQRAHDGTGRDVLFRARTA